MRLLDFIYAYITYINSFYVTLDELFKESKIIYSGHKRSMPVRFMSAAGRLYIVFKHIHEIDSEYVTWSIEEVIESSFGGYQGNFIVYNQEAFDKALEYSKQIQDELTELSKPICFYSNGIRCKVILATSADHQIGLNARFSFYYGDYETKDLIYDFKSKMFFTPNECTWDFIDELTFPIKNLPICMQSLFEGRVMPSFEPLDIVFLESEEELTKRLRKEK